MTHPAILPELAVTLARLPPGKRALELPYPDVLGQRTKLGGEPDWIQAPDVPACADCGESMSFVAQIDSAEHDSAHNPLRRDSLGHQDYMFGDVGMIYVFFCFPCCRTESVFQCY